MRIGLPMSVDCRVNPNDTDTDTDLRHRRKQRTGSSPTTRCTGRSSRLAALPPVIAAVYEHSLLIRIASPGQVRHFASQSRSFFFVPQMLTSRPRAAAMLALAHIA